MLEIKFLILAKNCFVVIKIIKLILTTNLLLNIEMEKCLINKANNSKVAKWWSDIQI